MFVDSQKQKRLAEARAAVTSIAPQMGSPSAKSAKSPSGRPKSPAAIQQRHAQPSSTVLPEPSAVVLATAAKKPVTIGLRDMLPVVRALSGASGGAGASASTIATVKALPAQQQLALLAASLAVAGTDAAAVAVQVGTLTQFNIHA